MIVHSAEEYRSWLSKEARIPAGFRFFTSRLSFAPVERPEVSEVTMSLAMILSLPEDTVAVGVTTSNRFCGAPVLLARERLRGGRLRCVVVNNKVANVGAPQGLETAKKIAAAGAEAAGRMGVTISDDHALSVSTGVIGWSIPRASVLNALAGIEHGEVEPLAVAEAIMTTDRYPKMAWREHASGARCLAVAKGAGMVEPNLATMLGFVLLDVTANREQLDRVFRRVVERTFNAISVDGDQSTSDTVLCLANGASGVTLSDAELEGMLEPVCARLAEEIVRNGEGTGHVVQVTIGGLSDAVLARRIAKHVVNSPLVKTAVYGNDPNVGRLIAATGHALAQGDAPADVEIEKARLSVFGTTVFENGSFRLDGAVERALAEQLRTAQQDEKLVGYPQNRPKVPIRIDFTGRSGTDVTVLGSDLSYEYIRENADYRT